MCEETWKSTKKCILLQQNKDNCKLHIQPELVWKFSVEPVLPSNNPVIQQLQQECQGDA